MKQKEVIAVAFPGLAPVPTYMERGVILTICNGKCAIRWESGKYEIIDLYQISSKNEYKGNGIYFAS
jgi:hypothetical protein